MVKRTGKSKYRDLLNNGSSAPQKQSQAALGHNEARVLRELEDNRNRLFERLQKYKEELDSVELMSNKSEIDKRALADLMTSITTLSSSLNDKNQNEGNMTLIMTALNSILVLHQKMTEMRHRQYKLTKRVDELESQLTAEKDNKTQEK